MGLRYLNLLLSTTGLTLMIFNLLCLNSGSSAPPFRHPQMARIINRTHNVGMPRNRPIENTATETTAGIHPSHTPPMETVVRLHQKAQLRCEWIEHRKPIQSPTWIRSNQLPVDYSMKDALVFRYALDFVTGDFLISNVSLEDAGLWFCAERDPETGEFIVSSRPIRLIVIDPPMLPYLEVDGRRLDSGNQFLPLVEDAPLSVWCVVDGGLPAPNITWNMTIGKTTGKSALPLSVQPALHISDTNGTHQQLRSEARLSSVSREHHNATVTCSVHHESLDEPLNASVRLDVQYRAVFSINRWPGFGFPITEGIPGSLKCDIDSNPPTKPIWLKDNGPTPVPQLEDGFLNFTVMHRKHIGWYKCTNREVSSLGIYLNVRYDDNIKKAPDSNSEQARTEVIEGGAVKLECPLSSPAFWDRPNHLVILKPENEEPAKDPRHVIYEHVAKNLCARAASPRLEMYRSALHGDKDGDGEQSELRPPDVFPRKKMLNVSAGQTVELKVEFCANPPPQRNFWLVDRVLMTPGESTTTYIAHNLTAASSPHCFISALTLRKIRRKDAGEYVFLVKTPEGVAEGSVVVNVSGTTVSVAGRDNTAAPNTFCGVATLSFISTFLLKVLVL